MALQLGEHLRVRFYRDDIGTEVDKRAGQDAGASADICYPQGLRAADRCQGPSDGRIGIGRPVLCVLRRSSTKRRPTPPSVGQLTF
jgi:hypothetical protein